MRRDRLSLTFVAGALLLALASCTDALNGAAPATEVVIEGRTGTNAELNALPQVALVSESAGGVLAQASADESGAFRLVVGDSARGERVRLQVTDGGEMRARFRFALDRSRVALPEVNGLGVAARSTLTTDTLTVEGWGDEAGTHLALVENAAGDRRWEAAAGADGRASLPREALDEPGLTLVLATRETVDADATLVEIERLGRRTSLPVSAALGTAIASACVADGVVLPSCSGEASFAQALEYVFPTAIAPRHLLVRAWSGPAFLVERFLGDGVWETVARVTSPEAWLHVTLGEGGAAARYRLRLSEPGAAHTDGISFHAGP